MFASPGIIRLVISIAVVLPSVVQAQSSTKETLLLAPTCARCTVAVSKIGRLGGDGSEIDDADGFEDLRAVDARSFLVAPWKVHQVWLVNSKGKILQRYGADGEGPGEFRKPAGITIGGKDSFFVYDRKLGRVPLFTMAGPFQHSFRVPGGVSSVLPLGGGSAIVVGRLVAKDVKLSQQLTVFPVHFVRGDSVVRSFGEVVRRVDPREGFQMERILVSDGPNVLVLNRTYHYVVDQWDASGKSMTMRLVREPVWFKPFEHFNLPNPSDSPSPILAGAWIDDQHRLWVVGARAAPTWKRAIDPKAVRGEGGVLMYRVAKPELYREGFVEVIDLNSKTLLLSERLPVEPRYVLGKNVIGVVKNDPNTGSAVELYQLSLKN